jgi:glycosyltransferase involved in cell wall biosynthesis
VTRLINLLPWMPGHSGFGSYVQRVVPALDGWRLQLGANGEPTLLTPERWQATSQGQPQSGLPRLLQMFGLAQHGFSIKTLLARHGLGLNDLDCVYSPFFDALLALPPQIPQVITCHDLTPLLLPNSRKAWLRYRFWQPLHLRKARRVIAISQRVADHLLAFGVDGRKLTVIPNGIEVRDPRVTAPASDDLIVLARHDGNKNLLGLMRALAGVQRQLPGWTGTVRIIGRDGRQTAALRRLHEALPRPWQVQLIPALGTTELRLAMRQSLALISASAEEGFDYPVLEAKAEGLPTLLSDIAVHREFHHDSSMFFPVDDDGTVLAAHLQSLLQDGDLWQQLSQAGYALARQMSVGRQVAQIQALIDVISRG